MSTVSVSHIAFDAGTQIRAAMNESVVADYADRMTDGVVFPPVVVFTDGTCREDRSPIYYLADGFHRTQAALRIQLTDIPADVRTGTKDDALWFALGANRENGQRLSEADKSHAVALALRQWPEKMQREIAEQIGCARSLVSKVALKISAETPSGAGDMRGRELQNHQKRERIREMVAAGAQSIQIRDQLRAHPSVIAEVRAEMGMSKVDKSKSAVAQRRKDIKDMADRGFTTRQIAASIGITEDAVKSIAKSEDIVIHADRVVGPTKRHDANRIVERMAMDAATLCADVDLIHFADLDHSQVAAWIETFETARKQLATFIRRLKEQEKHGEAA